MRRQQNVTGFNKEKFIFLLAAVGFSAGLYLYLSTGPIALEVEQPISQQAPPVALSNLNAAPPLEENYYVVPGSITRMLEPRSGQLVNRDRKTPFAPKADFLKKNLPPPAAVVLAPPPPPPPPPPTETGKTDTKSKKEFGPEDRVAEVDYMGVVSLNGVAYGLLKPKDGGKSQRVKVGDKIPNYDYTVTKIEKQAVFVVDKDNRPYVVKNSRFSSIPLLADAGKDKIDDPFAEEPGDKDMKVKDVLAPKEPKTKEKPEKTPVKTPAPEKQPAKGGAQKGIDAEEKPVEARPAKGPAVEGAADAMRMKKLEDLIKRREEMMKKKGGGAK